MNKRIQSIIALVGALCIGLGAYMIINSPGSVSINNSGLVPVTTTQSTQTKRDSLDMSADYGIVMETVFHKHRKIAFSTPSEFFKFTGKTSWEGLKFDRMEELPSGLHFVDGRPLTKADYRRAMGGK